LQLPFAISQKEKKMKNVFRFLSVVFCLLTSINPSIAQWVQTTGPYDYIYALAVSGTNLFAGTSNGGVFLSTNKGTNWTAVNTGLTNKNVHALAVSGVNLFVGTGVVAVFFFPSTTAQAGLQSIPV
jgi:hypothetical protein